MLSRVTGASTFGVEAFLIDVETHVVNGLPRYFLVGLPDRAVSESRDRIEAAIRHCSFEMPRGRITVNLAPANLPKEGNAFDLPIAVGLLVMSRQVRGTSLDSTVIMGELALDGTLRPVKGVLSVAMEARKKKIKHLVVPKDNAGEAAVVEGLEVLGFNDLKEVVQWLNGLGAPEPASVDTIGLLNGTQQEGEPDYCEVRGQENVKRAMEVAAAGGHNLLMIGPPGSGKTMIARRIPSILPPLTLDEALETTRIHSVAGRLQAGKSLVTSRPFRSPHYTISETALVGGGSVPRPGEVSMAHNGVLFLDELPEFRRNVLEVLRLPVEDGQVCIARTKMSVTYPSRIMLVASMNPSPDGDWYNPDVPSVSTPDQIKRYLGKVSGPLIDRMDIQVEVHKVPYEELSKTMPSEASSEIRTRVIAARERQKERFSSVKGVFNNAQMSGSQARNWSCPDKAGMALLKRAMTMLGLSARAYDRILKVSRTIADLEGVAHVRAHHVAEAIQYRSLDRKAPM